MVWRILEGQRLNGTFGFDVSLPGFDVMTANLMQMAFTSDYGIPRLVTKGAVVSNPTSGAGPQGSGGAVPGAVMTTTTIAYGRTVYPIPMVAAIAVAPDWTIPLNTNAGQLGYIANQWTGYLLETPPSGNVIYGSSGIIKKNPSGLAQVNGEVANSWASARFTARATTDAIIFQTNCRSALTIKYLVLEQQ